MMYFLIKKNRFYLHPDCIMISITSEKTHSIGESPSGNNFAIQQVFVADRLRKKLATVLIHNEGTFTISYYLRLINDKLHPK